MVEHSTPSTPDSDVRMRGFVRRTTVAAALTWLDEHLSTQANEQVALSAAYGRVLASEVNSRVNVPGFDRSMMDGFAIQAAQAQGASAYQRLILTIIGESLPGAPFEGKLVAGQAVRIMTGAPIPHGADAVLPVEKVEVSGDQLFIQGDVSPGKNIGRVAEDITEGELVLSTGRCLRPQDVGVLSSIGESSVHVVRQPRVRIVTTGNELLPPGSTPGGYKIADSNSPMLSALIARDGGVAINPGIVPDDPHSILEAMRDDADVILVSGGSSVGQEDHAPALLAQHGDLAIHGVAMRPSSPAGMGRLGQRLVFLLPGNPVSCLCAYDFFAGRAIRMMGGLHKEWPYRKVVLKLKRKLSSVVGRVDYARVKVIGDEEVEPLAISGASMLSSTTRADGFVIIPGDSEGFPPGAEVEVFLYD